MTEKPVPDFGSAESAKVLAWCLARQIELLGRVRDALVRDTDLLWAVVVILLCCVHDTAKSILLLARSGQMRDCMMLARCAFETSLNAAFICAKGSAAAARAQRHAVQKSFRRIVSQLRLHKTLFDADVAAETDVPMPPEVEAAFREYTDKRGREITVWTPEPLAARITAISSRYGQKVARIFEVAHGGIYSDSSELIHGTLYGAMLALGQTKLVERIISPKELQGHFREHICMLLYLVSSTICTLIRVVDKERGMPEIRREAVQAAVKWGKAAGLTGSLYDFSHGEEKNARSSE